MSSFVSLLTRDIDPGCHVDIEPALGTIGLSDMARRLSAGSLDTGLPVPPADLVHTGVLDCFDRMIDGAVDVRLYFGGLHALVVEGGALERNILVQVPSGFNVGLYRRIAWLARDIRKFVISDGYTGPDRRFKAIGPPAGTDGRRDTDLSLKVGESSTPNISKDEIDAMLNGEVPMR